MCGSQGSKPLCPPVYGLLEWNVVGCVASKQRKFATALEAAESEIREPAGPMFPDSHFLCPQPLGARGLPQGNVVIRALIPVTRAPPS